MKIGFDAKRIFHNDTGLGNYGRTLVAAMQRLYPEHDYHLFTPSISTHDYAAPFTDSSKYTIHTSGAWPSSLWRSYRTPAIAKQLELDLYHGLSHELPLVRMPRSTASIVTFHDLIYEIYPHLFAPADLKMYRYKYRKSAALADHIVSISDSTSQDLQRIYGVSPTKISTVYQSYNPVLGQQDDDRLPATRDYYLYVGSIIPRKGLLQIVQAYEMIPPAGRLPLRVVGQGGDYLEQVKGYIRKQALESYFTFMGSVANDALADLYYHARGLILPSIYEGFGIPVIEALSQGTPVITSEVSSLPEAAGPGGLLIDPRNPAMIAHAMQQLTRDDDLCKQIGQLGRTYVETTFDLDQVTHQMMQLYHYVLSSK